MTEKYYTVDGIAELIKIHPKTIQRYIREGKLKANKVGKSWRVSGHDLSVFTEGGSDNVSMPFGVGEFNTQKEIKVSMVIDIPVANTDASIRIANTLTAVLNAKPAEYGDSSLQTQFLMPENVMRVMIWGNLEFSKSMMDYIAELVE
ncbi:MAG: helix-turn-helix domain-containing protein [Bacillota bacterium]